MTVASDDHYDKTKSPDGDLVGSNDHYDKTQAHDPNSFTKRSMITQTDMGNLPLLKRTNREALKYQRRVAIMRTSVHSSHSVMGPATSRKSQS